MPETPQPPKLPSDPSPEINKMLSGINQSKPQPENQTRNIQQETEQFLGTLSPELQESIHGFYRDIAKTIVSQQTSMNGDKAEVTVTPDRADYYKNRLKEILNSGFLNPHINPSKKIT